MAPLWGVNTCMVYPTMMNRNMIFKECHVWQIENEFEKAMNRNMIFKERHVWQIENEFEKAMKKQN
jgi:hypothetical protein